MISSLPDWFPVSPHCWQNAEGDTLFWSLDLHQWVAVIADRTAAPEYVRWKDPLVPPWHDVGLILHKLRPPYPPRPGPREVPK
jgi:hypothetical protein